MKNTFYVYVLKSAKSNKKLVGFTNDLDRRVKEHQNGEVESSKDLLPLDLIHMEIHTNEEDARKRQAFLNSKTGQDYLMNYHNAG